jgi:hypothetical protein
MNCGKRISIKARVCLALALLALAFEAGAVNADTSPVPATLQVSAGAGQLGVLGQVFLLPLQARVLAADGTPVAGASVYFEADHCRNDGTACLTPSGYASFAGHSDAVAVTNANGIAVAPALTAGDQEITTNVVATIYAEGPASSIIDTAYFWVHQVTSAGVPIASGFSGAWYDPTQSGHGLLVEVLPGNRMLAYWFAFSPDPEQSQQAWFGGVGNIVGNQAIIEADQGQGGRWVPEFDPALYELHAWGTLTFTFSDCNHGRVYYAGDGAASAWGVGTMELTRLTQLEGLSCP